MNALIETIIAWFKGLFSGGDTASSRRQAAKNVMPRELIARVLEECDAHAMEYSDTKRQLPCTFSIFLSEEDFDFFYRANRSEVEGEITDALRKYAQQTGDLMKLPSVTLRIDTELSKGECRVLTSFEANRVPPTPPFDPVQAEVASPEPAQQPVAPQEQVRQPVEASSPTTPPSGEKTVPGIIGIPTPPIEMLPSYAVVAADGTSYELKDGYVVGLMRRSDRALPNIILKPTTDLEFCSQNHGEFLQCDDGGFAYRNLSGNGTLILRGETSVRLSAGDDPVVLADGDQLVLGKGNPALTFTVA